MRERPILFSGPMVRAILAGNKTQTRRVVRQQPAGAWAAPGKTSCPYGQPSDRLWVREPWRSTADLDRCSGSQIAELCLDAGYNAPWAPIQYEADGARRDWKHTGTPPHDGPPQPGRYRHARFMPRWASRLELEVTGVRVERLQGISYEDALAEGAFDPRLFVGDECRDASVESADELARRLQWPQRSFRELWSSINGAGSWDANPWVWVVEFRRIEDGIAHG